MKMYTSGCGVLAVMLFASSVALAEEPTPIGSQITVFEKPDKKVKVYDYQREDMNKVFRELARDANISLIISDVVSGTVTVRFESKKPLEALGIICAAKRLTLENINGIYFVMTAEERNKGLHILDSHSLPVALAEFRKRYYDALLAKGFTKEQAMRIVTSEQLPLGELKLTP